MQAVPEQTRSASSVPVKEVKAAVYDYTIKMLFAAPFPGDRAAKLFANAIMQRRKRERHVPSAATKVFATRRRSPLRQEQPSTPRRTTRLKRRRTHLRCGENDKTYQESRNEKFLRTGDEKNLFPHFRADRDADKDKRPASLKIFSPICRKEQPLAKNI